MKLHPDFPERQKRLRPLREWIVSLACALLAAAVIRNCLFTVIRVSGASMSPTLLSGEHLFVTIADAKLGGVQRGDVVICRYPERNGLYFVKRIIAGPGDIVYRQNGVTHAAYPVRTGGTALSLLDIPLDPGNYTFNPSDDYAPLALGEDEYFVVGDNLYNSNDSRDLTGVGPIARDMIVGRVRRVIWPLSGIRTVE